VEINLNGVSGRLRARLSWPLVRYDALDVLCPSVEGVALFDTPIMPLIHAHDTGLRATDVVEDRFSDVA
jgi:hypothetical protein